MRAGTEGEGKKGCGHRRALRDRQIGVRAPCGACGVLRDAVQGVEGIGRGKDNPWFHGTLAPVFRKVPRLEHAVLSKFAASEVRSALGRARGVEIEYRDPDESWGFSVLRSQGLDAGPHLRAEGRGKDAQAARSGAVGRRLQRVPVATS